MKTILLLTSLCFSVALLAQDKKQLKQITRIIGEGFKMKEPVIWKNPLTLSGIQIDTSMSNPGDTTGIHRGGEFLRFRSTETNYPKKELKTFEKQSFVSVKEYEEFKNWVRDSIARELAYMGSEEDYFAERFICVTDAYYDDERLELVEYNPSDRELNRQLFNLNWDRKFYFWDPTLVPVLASMYVPKHERIYRKRVIDERKPAFRHYRILHVTDQMREKSRHDAIRICYEPKFIVERVTHVVNDDFAWARNARHQNDLYSTLARHYSKCIPEAPVIGIQGSQAVAFCSWKQTMINQQFQNAGLPFYAIVTLPDENTNEMKFSLSEKDYSDQWKITYGEYQQFIREVQDSLAKEFIFRHAPDDETANRYLNFTEMCFDEASLGYKQFNPKQRNGNRELFTLNQDRRLPKETEMERLYPRFTKRQAYADTYTFYFWDAMDRGAIGNYAINPGRGNYEVTLKRDTLLGLPHDVYQGKDLDLSVVDRFGHGTGVRHFEDLARFIVKEQVVINPGLDTTTFDFSQHDKDAQMTELHYVQALAFYHWKYKPDFADEDSDWESFIFPSKEEYEKIRKGELVKREAITIPFPTPLFRYVVHIYR